MAATVRIYQETGTGTTTKTNVDAADGTPPKFGTDDAVASASAISIPNTLGTNYSANKLCYLNVTVAGATTISNRQVKQNAAFSDIHLAFFWKALAAYAQGAVLTASGSAGPATPATYTAMTTSLALWDNTGVSTASTGKNGNYLSLAVGVDNSFAAGANSAFANPDLTFSYDEA